MRHSSNKSVTLIELLIAITLMGLIVLGFSSIELFSRYQVVTTDKRAQVQNEASYILEHMAKEIGRAIGSRVVTGEDPVDLSAIGGDTAIRVYVDLASDGQSAGDGQRGTPPGGDRWRAYRFNDVTNEIWYYPNYVDPSSSYEVITKKITNFTRSVADNYVSVDITACDDPDGTPQSCGTPDNPQVSMKTNIKMPSVSVY